METLRGNTITASIRVKDIQKSLDFYTKTLGFQTFGALMRKDGRIAHVSVGFDSPLLMISPVDDVRTLQTKEELAKHKHGVGVGFYIGMNGSMKLDEFFGKLRAKGVAVISEPETEFWGDRTFTLRDPDGYALTFSEYVNDVSPEAKRAVFEATHKK
jgi:uncharacterized glyoxalase superfamily protein PhnB